MFNVIALLFGTLQRTSINTVPQFLHAMVLTCAHNRYDASIGTFRWYYYHHDAQCCDENSSVSLSSVCVCVCLCVCSLMVTSVHVSECSITSNHKSCKNASLPRFSALWRAMIGHDTSKLPPPTRVFSANIIVTRADM